MYRVVSVSARLKLSLKKDAQSRIRCPGTRRHEADESAPTIASVSLCERRCRPDNRLVYVPTGYVNQAQLADIITQAAKELGPAVVHVAYSLGPESTGEPSLFFRILLADGS